MNYAIWSLTDAPGIPAYCVVDDTVYGPQHQNHAPPYNPQDSEREERHELQPSSRHSRHQNDRDTGPVVDGTCSFSNR